MLSWLKKLLEIGPIVLKYTPWAQSSDLVVSLISIAEHIPGATGAQKKEIVTQLSLDAVSIINKVMNVPIIDPNVINNNSISSAIDTVVNVTNLIHKNSSTE